MRFGHIRWASLSIRQGGVIAYPTEAVYGLGCSPGDAAAVSRLRSLKRRHASKGLIVVAAHVEQLETLIDFNREFLTEAVLSSWAGPVTWVLPASAQVPAWLIGSQHDIAVRVSAHPVVQRLCLSAGPLVSTSANPAGARPATTAFRVRAYFGNQLDYIVPGETGPLQQPTEIRDAVTGELLRKGAG